MRRFLKLAPRFATLYGLAACTAPDEAATGLPDAGLAPDPDAAAAATTPAQPEATEAPAAAQDAPEAPVEPEITPEPEPEIEVTEFLDATEGWAIRSELATAGGGLAWPTDVWPLVAVTSGLTCMIHPDSGQTLTPVSSVYVGDYYSNRQAYQVNPITTGWSIAVMHGTVDGSRAVGSARQGTDGRLFLLDPTDSWIAATPTLEAFTTAVTGPDLVVALHHSHGFCAATVFDGGLVELGSQFLPEGACDGVLPALDAPGRALYVSGVDGLTRVNLETGDWSTIPGQGDLLGWSEAHDALYVATFGLDTVTAFSADGAALWTRRVAGATTAITTSDDRVFLGVAESGGGAVVALDPTDGSGETILRPNAAPTRLWAEPTSGRVALGEGQLVRFAGRE